MIIVRIRLIFWIFVERFLSEEFRVGICLYFCLCVNVFTCVRECVFEIVCLCLCFKNILFRFLEEKEELIII